MAESTYSNAFPLNGTSPHTIYQTTFLESNDSTQVRELDFSDYLKDDPDLYQSSYGPILSHCSIPRPYRHLNFQPSDSDTENNTPLPELRSYLQAPSGSLTTISPQKLQKVETLPGHYGGGTERIHFAQGLGYTQSQTTTIERYVLFLPQYGVLICRLCKRAIPPRRGIQSHIQRNHSELPESIRRQWIQYARCLPIKDVDDITVPKPTSKQIPILKVMKGYQCDECGYVCTEKRKMIGHCTMEHRWVKDQGGKRRRCKHFSNLNTSLFGHP